MGYRLSFNREGVENGAWLRASSAFVGNGRIMRPCRLRLPVGQTAGERYDVQIEIAARDDLCRSRGCRTRRRSPLIRCGVRPEQADLGHGRGGPARLDESSRARGGRSENRRREDRPLGLRAWSSDGVDATRVVEKFVEAGDDRDGE